MNYITKIKSGKKKGLYKWVSKDAIYYSPRKGPLKRRRDGEEA